jgi:hypothetical protein
MLIITSDTRSVTGVCGGHDAVAHAAVSKEIMHSTYAFVLNNWYAGRPVKLITPMRCPGASVTPAPQLEMPLLGIPIHNTVLLEPGDVVPRAHPKFFSS